MNAGIPTVIDYPSRHWMGRYGHPILYIVVHSTVSAVGVDPWETLRYLEENPRGVSPHELVLPGYAYRMVTDERATQHCWSKSVQFPGGEHYNLANCITWGIELYQVKGGPVTPGVVCLGVERVAAACVRLGLNAFRVLGHGEIDPERKSDPVGVDMHQFRAQVAGVLRREPRRFVDCYK